MEELRECAFYRPRGGSGRQRRDGVQVREQGQRCSEERRCRHTRDEIAKPAGAAKRDGAAVRNGAESYRTVTCGLIVGPECRDVRECGLARVARSAKGSSFGERKRHREGHLEQDIGTWRRKTRSFSPG